ncbi:MAG: DNA-directed RNA polymerase subunit D [Euryarchaeota archaeon]|jgi:DNA-directed RNA polymerase subunit D|nr:DNA-directed RNA polymerase subunit D [Euryarchaeota archaeon]
MDGKFDIEFVEREERSGRFLVRNVTPAFANGVRRAMIADVPTLAIDSVRFIENSSVMFNEQLALRLGLVPLTTPDDYEIGEAVTLALDVEGPGTAYSGDLVSSDEQVGPAEQNVPIIELKEGQRLEIEADAVLDVGREHAKHQGGVSVGYRNLVRVTEEGDTEEFADEEVNIVRGVIETEEGELVLTEAFDHDLTKRYPGKKLRVEDVPGAFVFHVETDGSMTVDELVDRAAASIGDRAAELEDAVSI